MNIVENSKQFDFLMAIKGLGMAIVFRKANPKMVLDLFVGFDDYIEDEDKLFEYIDSLQKISEKIAKEKCSPDDVLMELGQYTPYIIYNDFEDDVDQTSLDDSWLYE